ncbi:Uncharacterised protein [Bacillus paranthracis]|nr:Uncharacterised protein [Bacillus paranthracis]
MLIFVLLTLRNSSFPIVAISSPSMYICPAVGLISWFNIRTNVDFPLPDNPIITKISPVYTSNVAFFTPTFIPVSFKISDLLFPSFNKVSALCGCFPNTFVTFSTRTFVLSMSLLLFYPSIHIVLRFCKEILHKNNIYKISLKFFFPFIIRMLTYTFI